MTISIDGHTHSGKVAVQFGEAFPKMYQSREIDHPDYGGCLIYIVRVGLPEWSNKLTVNVPITYYITEVKEPTREYLNKRKRKKIGMALVKG